ncbi:MAG: hypothetical protein WAX89_05395 [Alphaproteobacteria bacterium]
MTNKLNDDAKAALRPLLQGKSLRNTEPADIDTAIALVRAEHPELADWKGWKGLAYELKTPRRQEMEQRAADPVYAARRAVEAILNASYKRAMDVPLWDIEAAVELVRDSGEFTLTPNQWHQVQGRLASHANDCAFYAGRGHFTWAEATFG